MNKKNIGIEKIRGVEDLIGQKAYTFANLQSYFSLMARLNGYLYIQTPIIENKNLFIRSVGNSSDIIQKELYEFTDKADRDIALRPEGTAGVIRAIVNAKLLNITPTPLKLFYFGPMFRYERPQSGRLREFHQFGVECIDSNLYLDDVELICFANSLLESLKLENYEISINNIGGFETRKKWIEKLTIYFSKYKDQLTEDSQKRIKTNPLRILDDKVDGTKEFVINAPKIDEFLTNEEKIYFDNIINGLKKLNIKFKINPTLVRGLDYYTNFVFEINSLDEALKGQPTLIGGGRYNSLVKEFGGKNVSCIGFACGIERLIIALNQQEITLENKHEIHCIFCCLTEQAQSVALQFMQVMRKNGIACVTNFNSLKLKSNFNYADYYKAKYVIIIGEQELKDKVVQVKNQITKEQKTIDYRNLINEIMK